MTNSRINFNKSYLWIIIPSVISGMFFLGLIIHFIIFNLTYVSPQQEIIESIGKSECEAYYSNNGFQDYTDFGIYAFSDPEIEKADKFQKGYSQNDVASYLNNFEEMVGSYSNDIEIKKYYNFDRSIIDSEDYIYIYDKANDEELYSQFMYYDIYIFDVQSDKLYYFHNNI